MSALALIRQAQESGVELRLVDGRIKAIGRRDAVAKMIEPLRQHRAELLDALAQPAPPEPAPDPATWRALHAEYMAHHWTCPTCIAGGQERGLRCGFGAALWTTYTGAAS